MAEPFLHVGPDDAPDKYRLKRQISTGGEAQLWEAALDVAGTWEPVAVKILRADHFADFERWKDRWAEQAEVLRFIRHPGVVGVREHFEGSGMHYGGEAPPSQRALYLIMNWHEGLTFREWRQRHLSAADGYEALRLLAQVGDVLDWLHSGQATPSGRPVIHADVTANNVLVTPVGQAVLIDFGLVRLAGGVSAAAEGTSGYLAPEVKALGAYSTASDRYAFGALTYFVLTGQVPSPGIDDIRSGLARLSIVVQQPALLDHLMRMFDPEPDTRPPCGEWIRHFRMSGATSADLVGSGFTPPLEPGASSPPDGQPGLSSAPPPARRGRNRRIVVAGALVVAAIGGGVAYSISRDDGGDSHASGTSGPATSSTVDVVNVAGAGDALTSVTSPSRAGVVSSTAVPRATTTSARATTTVATTTTPATTTSSVAHADPVPAEAFVLLAGCAYGAPRVGNTETPAAYCGFGYGPDATSEKSIDLNVSPDASRLTARLVFADDTLPVETVGLVKVLVDGAPAQEGTVTFASPFPVDIDVADTSRVTFRVSIGEDSQPNLARATFALVEAFFVG